MRIKLGGTGKYDLSRTSEGYDDEEDEAEEVTPAKRRTTKSKLADERPIKIAASAKKAPVKTAPRKPATKCAPGTGKPATKTTAKTATKRVLAKKHAA